MAELDKDRAVALLNRILEAELAGVVRSPIIRFLCSATIEFPSCRGCANRQPSRSPMPSRQGK